MIKSIKKSSIQRNSALTLILNCNAKIKEAIEIMKRLEKETYVA